LAILILFPEQSMLREADATILPLDSISQNVAIDATLSNLDLASSQTSFVPAQTDMVKLDSLWVNCGINNRGPIASIRVYLDLASDSIKVYFEFVSVYSGWNGVASGSVDYIQGSANAWQSPNGASRTGVSVQLENNYVNSAGGGFNSVVRIWAEGDSISVYAGECQYGIDYESAPPNPTPPSNPIGPMVLLVLAVFVIGSVLAFAIVRQKNVQRVKSLPRCPNCGSITSLQGRYCTKCGASTDVTRMYDS